MTKEVAVDGSITLSGFLTMFGYKKVSDSLRATFLVNCLSFPEFPPLSSLLSSFLLPFVLFIHSMIFHLSLLES